ncbi:putative Histidine kinase [Candidatus Sulfopaludibacter sp. SbA4]|nr:putative Histidine kinase [Candidatus Sulfopaludibacter sp. SbA4]
MKRKGRGAPPYRTGADSRRGRFARDPQKRAPWRLQNLPIGVRLRLAFAGVLLLLLLGSSVSLWEWRNIRQQVERVSLVEQRMTAILKLDNSVLTLMNQLHRAADMRQRDLFEAEATRLLAALHADTAGASDALHSTTPVNNRQAVNLDSLNSMLDALPARVESMVELARHEDWTALDARLTNQVDHSDDVVAALVREIDADLRDARTRLVDDVQRAQRRTAEILAATGLACFLAAAFLGVAVTRSITRPLASLDVGARALARGHFGHRVTVSGNDELAQLAQVFNRTTDELNSLYAKVRHSEAYFRSLIENASDLIVILDRAGILVYASPSSLRVLGDAADDLVRRPLRDLVHADDAARAAELVAGAQQGSSPGPSPRQSPALPFALRFRHHDGSYRLLEGLATNLLTDPAVSGIVINARDVTERHLAEQALRERDEQLRQAQKMEAIGRLAGGVAHDFNNLLTVINGYSEFLLNALDASDRRHGYAQSIRDAGEHAADLTRQLLAFGRKQLLRPTVLNLNAIVGGTERILRRLIGEDIDLVCALDPAAGGVMADANQVHQVLMNLCANARDAMPEGGTLTIATANEVCSAPRAGVGAYVPPGEYVTLAVSDTGHGMDEATQQRVFEPFFTTKEHGKGIGLGLATVYGIVRQSGGHIAIESAPGEGTTFRVYLPRVAQPAADHEVASPLSLSGNETILLVEDEAAVREVAVTALRSYGYAVIEAADGDEACRLYTNREEPIHLLLTDVVMPGMNGMELAKRLRSLDPQLKVVFVSGYADSIILRQGAPDESVNFVQKPYRPVLLASKIREVLGE